MIKKIIVLMFLVAFCLEVHSQSNPLGFYDKNTTLPTSPEAALLGRFGNIPIGYYTGTANIAIPLYTIKEAGLEIPITLRYHSSGIKVEDQASWVGLGWSLEPEGVIIQNVMGEEDKMDDLIASDEEGYYNLKGRMVSGTYCATYEKGKEHWSVPGDLICYDYTPDPDSYITIEKLLQGNGQPDIYQYNFAGYSGKFYINPETDDVVLIDKKEDIEFYNDPNRNWEVTTLDGHVFYFKALEKSSSYNVNENKGYTWKMTKIKLKNGREIDFNYVDGHYAWPIYNETWTNNANFGDNSYFKYSDMTQHNTKTLSQIVTTNLIVDFNLEEREDINWGLGNDVKRLKSIDISSVVSGKKIKSFEFNYGYFPFSTDGGSFTNQTSDILGKRLKLQAVEEIGYNSSGLPVLSKPPYKFEYDLSTTLPLKTSFAQDFYGYYNGADNNELIPDLSYFYYAGAENYGHSQSDYPEPSTLRYLIGDGANRIPDTTKATAGMLERIIYPTGGYTEFDYEPNAFDNYFYPNKSFIEESWKNVRVEDANVASDKKSEQFTLGKTTKLKFLPYIVNGLNDPPIGYGKLPPESAYIRFEKVRSINGHPSRSIIKQWDLSTVLNADYMENGGKRWDETIEVIYDPDPTVYYEISVAFPDALGPQNYSDKVGSTGCVINYIDNTQMNRTSHQCGVRVAAVRNYSADGKILNNKSIRYIDADGSTSGKLISPMTFLYSMHMWNTEKKGIDTYAIVDMISHFRSSDSYTGGRDNFVGYSRVEEVSLDEDGNSNGKQVYYYTNEPNKFLINLPDVPNLASGRLDSVQIFDSQDNLLKETKYFYKSLLPQQISFSGIKIISFFTGIDPCMYCGGLAGEDNVTCPGRKYNILFYPIISGWNVLEKRITNEFFNLNKLTTTASYEYNSKGQVVKQTTENSKQETLVTESVYPTDISLDDPQERQSQADLLENFALYNNILNRSTIFNDKEITNLKFFYRHENGILIKGDIVRAKIERSYNGEAFLAEVEYDKYGENQALNQFTEKGITTSLLWDDTNTNIVAATKNAEFNEVAYTGFEDNRPGNWVYDPLGVVTQYSYTGKCCYLISSEMPISKLNLNSSTTYLVSYWAKNPNPFTVAGTVNSPIKGETLNGWTYYEHKIKGSTNTSVKGSGYIDELRFYPEDAEMITYTYDPLIGISAVTDANNITTFYNYDGLKRLKSVKDYKEDILQHYHYNYRIK